MVARTPGLGEWLLVVDVEVDPEVEQEWNRWYDEVHVPEITDCPGFLRSARYVNDDGGSRSYLSVYEVTGPDVLSSEEFQSRRGWGEFTDRVRFRTRIYRQRTYYDPADGRA